MNYIKRIKEAYKKSHYYWKQVIKTPKPRVLYVGGWLGKNNLGDEALYCAYKTLFPQLNFIHYPSPGGNILLYLNQLFKPSKTAFLAGGTLINSSSGYYHSTREVLMFSDKYFVFGTGVRAPYFWEDYYDPKYTNNIKLWLDIADKFQYIGVRGPLSYQILKSYGFNEVEIIGDPVLSLALNKKTEATPNAIGLNIGSSNNQIWGRDESKLVQPYVQLAKILKEKGWKVKWYVVCPADLEITNECAKKSNTSQCVENHYHNYGLFLESAKKLSVFVGMKLHSVILATCCYIPSIMIEYRPKCLDYMQSINREEYNIRCDKINVDTLVGFVEELSIENCTQSENIFQAVNELKSRQMQKASEIQEGILCRR